MTAKCKLSLLVLIMFIYRLFVNPIFFYHGTIQPFNGDCQLPGSEKNAFLNKPAFLDQFTASQLGNGYKCDLQHQWRIFFLIECNKFHVYLNWRMRVSQNLDLMDFLQILSIFLSCYFFMSIFVVAHFIFILPYGTVTG